MAVCSSLGALLTIQIQWVLLISRQGKVRLSKWYGTMSQKSKAKIVKDVTQLILARRVRLYLLINHSHACATLSNTRVGILLTHNRKQNCVSTVCLVVFCRWHRTG